LSNTSFSLKKLEGFLVKKDILPGIGNGISSLVVNILQLLPELSKVCFVVCMCPAFFVMYYLSTVLKFFFRVLCNTV
jgi:hypothetical protein